MGKSRNGFLVLYPFYPPSRIELLQRMTTTQHGSPLSRNTTLKKRIPEENRDDMGEDDDDVSVGSDTTFKSSGHDTDRTNRMTTANRTQRRNQRKRKESQGRCPTNARKEDKRHKGKVVLSLFRDSPKEGALTYTDWCREVEEYIRKGYDDSQIKDAHAVFRRGTGITLTFVPAMKEGIALRRRS